MGNKGGKLVKIGGIGSHVKIQGREFEVDDSTHYELLVQML